MWIHYTVPDFFQWVELFATSRAVRLDLTKGSDFKFVGSVSIESCQVGTNHRCLASHLSQLHISMLKSTNCGDVFVAVDGDILSPGG